MPVFKSSEDLKEVLGNFFELVVADPAIGKKLIESKLIIKFNYKNPTLSITANCRGEESIITYNDNNIKPEVEMFMDTDIAHKFWMGEINLVMALARRQMVLKGPVPRILKLLPVIKPAFKMYRNYLKEKGFTL